MEYLAPAHDFLLFLIYEMESGGSTRTAVKKYVELRPQPWNRFLQTWLFFLQSEQNQTVEIHFQTGLQKNIWSLLNISQAGGSILTNLYELEKEVRFICEEHLEQHVSSLPYKMMIPILFFQFPALLLVMLGPIILQFIEGVG